MNQICFAKGSSAFVVRGTKTEIVHTVDFAPPSSTAVKNLRLAEMEASVCSRGPALTNAFAQNGGPAR